ncbi:hypothetical protein HLB23_00775 [Nocardia uniformis]|uniref:FAS1-like dehydratase domain-containing protein n=1 Tax=Nocardia uniformis TaxID=53432 RepID=A0A849C638_9NOCA|nr:MaoC family dehydratase N-terminal domain-containing protein [Nocardia uniformis]NNH68431.1 hypothetical protein [Nocardia uniformis]
MTRTVGSAADRAHDLTGHHYRCAKPFTVDRTRIREYARAVRAYHPVHWPESAAAVFGFDAVVAPPTFASLIWQQARRELLRNLVTGYRPERILHIDQVLEIGRPLLAGDVLTCDIFFESFRSYRTYDVLTVTGLLVDQAGLPVQSGSSALLVRTDEPQGDVSRVRAPRRGCLLATDDGVAPVPHLRLTPPAFDFERLTTGTQLPTATTRLAPRDLGIYARVMGDTDPIGPDTGPSAPGTPAVVAPSTLILALAAGYASSCAADPTALTTFRAEFANHIHYLPVPPDHTAEIEFSGRVVAIDGRRRTATVAIDAYSQGRKLFGYATADLRFPRANLG